MTKDLTGILYLCQYAFTLVVIRYFWATTIWRQPFGLNFFEPSVLALVWKLTCHNCVQWNGYKHGWNFNAYHNCKL